MGVNRHVKLTLRGGEQWCSSKLWAGGLCTLITHYACTERVSACMQAVLRSERGCAMRAACVERCVTEHKRQFSQSTRVPLAGVVCACACVLHVSFIRNVKCEG
jgi:hypothetical protein